MKRRTQPLTSLNPAFAHLTNVELIARLEQACVFASGELESELNARLERTGQQWRFVPHGIELFYPAKMRREQKPCNVGLFDRDGRRQVDLAELL